MKKTLLFALAALLLWCPMVKAQDDARNVPTAVLNAFLIKYPNMKVKDWDWEDDKDLWEAEFLMNGREHEAYFAPDGTWKKTKVDLKKSQLPVAVLTALTTGDYKSWDMDDFMEIDSPDKGRAYKVKVKKGGEEVYLKYDVSGKLIDRKTKAEKKAMKKS